MTAIRPPVASRTGHHDRGHLVGVQEVDVFQLAGGLAERVADDDQAPAGRGDLLQTAGDLGEVRVGDVVDQDADGVAVVAGQHLGVRVRHVAQFGHRRQDPGSELLGHRLRAAIDDP